MIKWASEFDSIPDKSPDLGALNFALMLVALIGCEALGFYTEGAHRHLQAVRDECPRLPDPGTYLMQVIQHYLPRGSIYKHLDKVLADELRHDLVHGFGSLGRRGAVGLACNAASPAMKPGSDSGGARPPLRQAAGALRPHRADAPSRRASVRSALAPGLSAGYYPRPGGERSRRAWSGTMKSGVNLRPRFRRNYSSGLKLHCVKTGVLIQGFVTRALREKLDRDGRRGRGRE